MHTCPHLELVHYHIILDQQEDGLALSTEYIPSSNECALDQCTNISSSRITT
jgi:hypothetical protein